MNTELLTKVTQEIASLTELLIEKKITVSTMESCTAGLLATLFAETEGASEIMKGAFVTYSNEAKIRQGVPEEVIREYGVYSKETAGEMAKACAKAYGAVLGIGITGSIGRADPENSDSVPGEAAFGILFGEDLHTYSVTVTPTGSRLDAKLEILHVIYLMLRRILL